MNYTEQLKTRLGELTNGDEWQSYLWSKDFVLNLLNELMVDDHISSGASNYWREELRGFEYMLDASPLIVSSLREHCYHITGLKSYEYRKHHQHRQGDFLWKYNLLRDKDEIGIFVPESKCLGGFGFDFGRGLVNIDTLKFYESLLALTKANFIYPRKAQHERRKLVLEIGSGWGGFAYQFKLTIPNTTYVCIDLPGSFIFSATYLKTVFPGANFLCCTGDVFMKEIKNWAEYDFIFVPAFRLEILRGIEIDLAINMVSFQEMSESQVTQYLAFLRENECKKIYSLNRDRSKHNNQLDSVTRILSMFYNITLIEVCELQYTELRPLSKKRSPSVYDYKHLVAQVR